MKLAEIINHVDLNINREYNKVKSSALIDAIFCYLYDSREVILLKKYIHYSELMLLWIKKEKQF